VRSARRLAARIVGVDLRDGINHPGMPKPGTSRGYRDCPRDDAEVKPERLALHIVQVPLDALCPSKRVPALDLGQAGDARPDSKPPLLEGVVALDLVRQGGPRPDDAHLAPQDVDKLRQFVKREPAEETADGREPRVVRKHRVGTIEHRAELERDEWLPIAADALLAEDDRAGSTEAHRHRADKPHDSGGHGSYDQQAQVEGALAYVLPLRPKRQTDQPVLTDDDFTSIQGFGS
jgi:hypothetical protein